MGTSNLPKRKGILFIISAPSGAGKTSLIRALSANDQKIKVSVSYTTRPARANEQTGSAYHFVDDATFLKMVKQDLFLEHARVFEYRYGTLRSSVEDQLAQGFNLVLEIDWQGARQIRSVFDNAVSVFVLPPTYDELSSRLTQREEAQEVIKRRMRDTDNELAHYREYDFIVINDSFETALTELKSIIQANSLSRAHQADFYDAFVRGLVAQDS